jgi:hypothetical protein
LPLLPEAMPAWIKRLSLGLEYQRANFSANINKYHMFSDKKLVNSG